MALGWQPEITFFVLNKPRDDLCLNILENPEINGPVWLFAWDYINLLMVATLQPPMKLAH